MGGQEQGQGAQLPFVDLPNLLYYNLPKSTAVSRAADRAAARNFTRRGDVCAVKQANAKTKEKTGEKTNVMRILDQKKIPYRSHYYADTGAVSGMEVADVLHEDPDRAFKTLVTRSGGGAYYVFLVPVSGELNLKKAAKAVQEKSIEMIKAKELLPLTGYVHGGCSPIGMKKQFPTVVDQSAEQFETILFSGGKIGYQVEVSLEDLKKVIPFKMLDISDKMH